MRNIRHPFCKWEDWKSGMYKEGSAVCEKMLNRCVGLLSDQDYFVRVAKLVVSKWVFSTEHNLTNLDINRKAWIGQASCCFALEAPCYITKIAWNSLSANIQTQANLTAQSVIDLWVLERHSKPVQLNLFYAKNIP